MCTYECMYHTNVCMHLCMCVCVCVCYVHLCRQTTDGVDADKETAMERVP